MGIVCQWTWNADFSSGGEVHTPSSLCLVWEMSLLVNYPVLKIKLFLFFSFDAIEVFLKLFPFPGDYAVSRCAVCQYFLPPCRLSVHSVGFFLHSVQTFEFYLDIILVCVSFPGLLCLAPQKILTHSNALSYFLYVFSSNSFAVSNNRCKCLNCLKLMFVTVKRCIFDKM